MQQRTSFSPAEIVTLMAKHGATQEEIADEMGISADTLQKGSKLYEAWRHGYDNVTLSGLQRKAAQAGNATMLIWLGKQYLGQTNKRR